VRRRNTSIIPIHCLAINRPSTSKGANGAAYETIGADMADMETYAVMRAAWRAGVAVITLRGISDGAEPLARFADWTRYLAEIDEKLAAIIAGLDDAFAQRPAEYWAAIQPPKGEG